MVRVIRAEVAWAWGRLSVCLEPSAGFDQGVP